MFFLGNRDRNDRSHPAHRTDSQAANPAQTGTGDNSIALPNRASNELADSGESSNEIPSFVEKGWNFLTTSFGLRAEERDELLSITLFVKRQPELKTTAQEGQLHKKDLELLKQAEDTIDKYLKLLKEIKKLNEENSSWIE